VLHFLDRFVILMLAECVEEHTSESEFNARHSALLATGSKEPLLGLPALGKKG